MPGVGQAGHWLAWLHHTHPSVSEAMAQCPVHGEEQLGGGMQGFLLGSTNTGHVGKLPSPGGVFLQEAHCPKPEGSSELSGLVARDRSLRGICPVPFKPSKPGPRITSQKPTRKLPARVGVGNTTENVHMKKCTHHCAKMHTSLCKNAQLGPGLAYDDSMS